MKDYERAYKDKLSGMPYKDIAAKYKVSVNTVKSWSNRHWSKMPKDEIIKTVSRDAHNAHQKDKVCIPGAKGAKTADEKRAELVSKAAHRPPAYSDPLLMIGRLAEYFYKQDHPESEGEGVRPYTITGLSNALRTTERTTARYLEGELDYLLEEGNFISDRENKTIDLNSTPDYLRPYIEILAGCDFDEIGEKTGGQNGGYDVCLHFSRVLKRAWQIVKEQAETRLYNKGRVGDIFTMKQHGWRDENSPTTTNNTLVIASADEANKALAMLYGSK